MEAMNLVEVVLNNENETDDPPSFNENEPLSKSSPIKGLDESVTITVTRTPGRPVVKDPTERRTGKPASFALMSNMRNGVRNPDAPAPRARTIPREELVCKACDRIFKYKAAFIRHEAQCGLPVALKIERNAIIEAKKAEKAAAAAAAAEAAKSKVFEKPPEYRCPTCLKQFSDEILFKKHDFEACAAERATYTFVCSVCQARFKYKNHMRRHEDSHNNVRRYNCDVCTTAFLRPDHLKRHMMRMHGIVQMPIQAPPKAPPMQCPVCSKILSRRDHVLRHMRNVHHRNWDTARKPDQLEDYLGSSGLFGGDVRAETDTNQSGGEDDGSENQSLTSHDGLRIDESFEDIKQERESPIPDEASAMMNDENGSSPGLEGRDCFANQFCQPQLNSNHDNGEDNSLNLKIPSVNFKPHLVKKEPEEDVDDYKPVDKFPSLWKKPLGETSSRPPQYTFKNHGQGFRSKSEFPLKTGQKNSSDGNQNVVPNGHVPRGVAEDWISDLVNFSGW